MRIRTLGDIKESWNDADFSALEVEDPDHGWTRELCDEMWAEPKPLSGDGLRFKLPPGVHYGHWSDGWRKFIPMQWRFDRAMGCSVSTSGTGMCPDCKKPTPLRMSFMGEHEPAYYAFVCHGKKHALRNESYQSVANEGTLAEMLELWDWGWGTC